MKHILILISLAATFTVNAQSYNWKQTTQPVQTEAVNNNSYCNANKNEYDNAKETLKLIAPPNFTVTFDEWTTENLQGTPVYCFREVLTMPVVPIQQSKTEVR